MQNRGIVFLSVIFFCANAGAQTLTIPAGQMADIAERVFMNECSGKDECLLAWNEGEDFMSAGIGHFIWYPAGKTGPFRESFPEFVEYLKSRGASVPEWLGADPIPSCPWPSREDFLKSRHEPKARELRQWLASTKPQQGEFLVERLRAFLPLMLSMLPPESQQKIKKQFDRVSDRPQGVYALVDYVNFKGMGLSASEQYKGKGWGLLQVLSNMRGEASAPDALNEFVESAITILTERVKNSPPERNEQRWLPGWVNRVNTYCVPRHSE